MSNGLQRARIDEHHQGSTVTAYAHRHTVAVLHFDAVTADLLQYGLEQAGYQASTFVQESYHTIEAAQAFLTPSPLVCVFGLSSPRTWVCWRTLAQRFPECRFVLTAPAPALLAAELPHGQAPAMLREAEDPDRLINDVVETVTRAIATNSTFIRQIKRP